MIITWIVAFGSYIASSMSMSDDKIIVYLNKSKFFIIYISF